MKRNVGHIAVVVRDYDEAIAFYTKAMGFELIEDTDRAIGSGSRLRWSSAIRRRRE